MPGEMNPAVKAKWVAALLSGKYSQARSQLEDVETGGMCCLGVLCDLAIKDGVQVQRIVTGESVLYGNDDRADAALPPTEVVKWAGLSDDNPYVVDWRGERMSLAEWNDSGMSFEDIAGLIERNL